MKSKQKEGRDYVVIGPVWDEGQLGEFKNPRLAIYKSGWIVSALLIVQNGRPVIGELQISPENTVIPGGLTSVFLKSIPLGAIHSKIAELEASVQLRIASGLESPFEGLFGFQVADPLKSLFPNSRGLAAARKRGRPGRPLEFYAKVAQTYADAGNLEPTRAVANKHRMTRDQARDAVSRARREKLLSETRPGFPGGHLTTKALAILEITSTPATKSNRTRKRTQKGPHKHGRQHPRQK